MRYIQQELGKWHSVRLGMKEHGLNLGIVDSHARLLEDKRIRALAT